MFEGAPDHLICWRVDAGRNEYTDENPFPKVDHPVAHETRPVDYRDRAEALTGVSLRACPVCADGHMIVTRAWLRGRAYPVRPDTS